MQLRFGALIVRQRLLLLLLLLMVIHGHWIDGVVLLVEHGVHLGQRRCRCLGLHLRQERRRRGDEGIVLVVLVVVLVLLLLLLLTGSWGPIGADEIVGCGGWRLIVVVVAVVRCVVVVVRGLRQRTSQGTCEYRGRCAVLVLPRGGGDRSPIVGAQLS